MVSRLTKILIYCIIMVPISAYLDAVIIRGMDFQSYLYICTWEMMIFIIGILVGIKTCQKN